MLFFFKCLPNNALTFKRLGERATLILGANMDGSDKLKVLLIGKSNINQYSKRRCIDISFYKELPKEVEKKFNYIKIFLKKKYVAWKKL